MFKRHYLTGVLVLLSLATGSAVASAAETGIKTTSDSSIRAIAYRHDPHRPFYGDRGLYDYAGPRAGYGYYPWYDDRWDAFTWSGNGYYKGSPSQPHFGGVPTNARQRKGTSKIMQIRPSMTVVPLLAAILVGPLVQANGEPGSDARVTHLVVLPAPVGHRQPTLDDLPPWLREMEKPGGRASPTQDTNSDKRRGTAR